MHNYKLKSLTYISIDNDSYLPLGSSFTALKVFCVLPVHPFTSPEPLAPADLFTVSIVLPFSRISCSWNYTVCRLSGLASSLSVIHWRFFHVFLWLHCLFFLLLNNISFSGCTTICLSSHLVKNTLVTLMFW